jgi:hypothetical protein
MVRKNGFLMEAGPDLPGNCRIPAGRPGPTFTDPILGGRCAILQCAQKAVTDQQFTRAKLTLPARAFVPRIEITGALRADRRSGC